MNKIDNCPCCGAPAASMVGVSGEYIKLKIFCIQCGLERSVLRHASEFNDLYSEMVDMIFRWNMRQGVSA